VPPQPSSALPLTDLGKKGADGYEMDAKKTGERKKSELNRDEMDRLAKTASIEATAPV
jgi:hypothetical protein